MTEPADSAELRFLTLNVGGPSEVRAARLVEFLSELSADVMVLTETRANRGTALLLDWCRQSGYAVDARQDMASGERGVALAQKLGGATSVRVSSVDLSHRLVAVELLADPGLLVVGAYVPSRDASPAKIARKQSFLKQMESRLRRWAPDKPMVLLGDLNIVARSHVPRYTAFRGWEYDALDALLAIGLVDAFAHLHPGVQAHSWVGRTGDGYRYDYAFASSCLVSQMVGCEYLHESRELGVSDHAGLLLKLRSGSVGRWSETDPVSTASLELV